MNNLLSLEINKKIQKVSLQKSPVRLLSFEGTGIQAGAFLFGVKHRDIFTSAKIPRGQLNQC